ncbi:MAG: hypothetical protein M3139_17830, partial [Bacteroidota bacterium]|nr:hypothetical protein [Bacteroidota bacterium]
MKNFIKKLANWHHWPSFLFYFPISFAWIWYCIKSRSIWFFSTSNPTLTFGGFEGESKKEMYVQLPPDYYPFTLYISLAISVSEVFTELKKSAINYPFIAKPEVGTSGILVRKIENEQQLRAYHKNVPVNYMIQDYVNYPLEICIFYYRMPGKEKGKISSFLSKQLPFLEGDGISTIAELSGRNKDAAIKEELCKLDANEIQRVLKEGERFNLSVVGNRYHGAEFYDLSGHITSQLLELFDNISLVNNFYYGRYDIKCASIENFVKG